MICQEYTLIHIGLEPIFINLSSLVHDSHRASIFYLFCCNLYSHSSPQAPLSILCVFFFKDLVKEGDELLKGIQRLGEKVVSRDEKIETLSKLLQQSLSDLRAVMEQEVKEKPLGK